MTNPNAMQQAWALATLLRHGRKPAEARRKIADQRLQRLLVDVGRHVPFYTDVFRDLGYNPATDYGGCEDLRLLPIVSKERIRSQYDRFQHQGLDKRRLYVDHSSGSTGSPFRVHYEPAQRAIHVANWIRVMMQTGYSPAGKAFALSLPSRLHNRTSLIQRCGILRRKAIDCTLPADKQADLLLAYRPDTLYGNRSSIELLALELSRRGIRPDFVKVVIAAGEVVTDSSRKLCVDVFGTPMRQLYSSRETGIMSADRAGDDGGQHPIYDLCHLEFLDANDRPVPEGRPGRVIASRLYSAAMPILRYDLGDLAVIRGSTEPDGSRGYRIVEIHGRNSDIIQLPGGRWLSMPVINNILNAQLAVRQFKVVQEGRCFFRIYIAASPAGYASVEPALQSQFDELFHAPSRYQMSRVDAIPPDASGKIRTIARLEERNKTSNETAPS